MHPALSIILFTTLSGLGFGLFVWLGLDRVPEASRAASTIVAFVLTVAGLSASTLHLGRPERAWRAFSQWRSSWLSREGVMAIVTLGLVPLWWWLNYPHWLGVLLAAAALLTVFTTSMIYAQMRSVRHWNTPLTPAVFLLMSLAGGGLLCAVAIAVGGGIGNGDVSAVALLLAAAWLAKVFWWRRADGPVEISTTASATGLAAVGHVRLLESPHTGSNYLLNEMGFRVGRKHARVLRRIALVAGAALPLLALLMSVPYGVTATILLAAAVVAHVIGVLAERWLFFAEARHALMSYYE